MQYVNLTGNEVILNNGLRFHPSETVATVTQEFSLCGDDEEVDFFEVVYHVTGLPDPVEDMLYIVTRPVYNAVYAYVWREDVITPAVEHPQSVRNLKGDIISVPGFIA